LKIFSLDIEGIFFFAAAAISIIFKRIFGPF